MHTNIEYRLVTLLLRAIGNEAPRVNTRGISGYFGGAPACAKLELRYGEGRESAEAGEKT